MLVNIGPNPAPNDGLVGFEHIVAKPEPGVQEISVVVARDVQILQQTEQPGAVKITEFGFDVTPSDRGFSLVYHTLHHGLSQSEVE
jgi:hypothetical protein